MDMYSIIIDDNLKPIPPEYNFDGELVHHVAVDARFGENIFYSTSVIKPHKGLFKLNIYKDGKKITSKRFDREKAVIQESYTLIDAVIMDSKLGYV